MMQIDETIINRCQTGDRDAFRSLVECCQGMVFSVALKMLADEDEAKDIVQETFLRVWQNISKYDSSKRFITWLYTIVTTCIMANLPDRKPRHETLSLRWLMAGIAASIVLRIGITLLMKIHTSVRSVHLQHS